MKDGEMADGVEVDVGRVDELLRHIVDGAAAARAHLAETWDRHEATATYEGQPFPFEPMESWP